MLDNMTTGEKVIAGATAVGIAALIFHKPTRNAVGLSDAGDNRLYSRKLVESRYKKRDKRAEKVMQQLKKDKIIDGGRVSITAMRNHKSKLNYTRADGSRWYMVADYDKHLKHAVFVDSKGNITKINTTD